MEMIDKLELIDFQNMVYRYTNVYHLYTDVNGVKVDTSALYGLLRYIKQSTGNIIFCIEGYPRLFKSYLPSYKGNRSKEFDESLVVKQSVLIAAGIQFAKMLGKQVQFVFSPNQEADQVVSSLVHVYKNQNLKNFGPDFPQADHYWKRLSVTLTTTKFEWVQPKEVLIRTTDSDMYQLIQPGVALSDSIVGNLERDYTPKAVHNLNPETIPVYKAFIGDVSDNIPNLIKDFPKNEAGKIIGDIIRTKQDLKDFIRKTRVGISFKGAEKLQEFITARGALPELERNAKVTSLEFYTMPWLLKAKESFDVVKVMKRYKIKL